MEEVKKLLEEALAKLETKDVDRLIAVIERLALAMERECIVTYPVYPVCPTYPTYPPMYPATWISANTSTGSSLYYNAGSEQGE